MQIWWLLSAVVRVIEHSFHIHHRQKLGIICIITQLILLQTKIMLLNGQVSFIHSKGISSDVSKSGELILMFADDRVITNEFGAQITLTNE